MRPVDMGGMHAVPAASQSITDDFANSTASHHNAKGDRTMQTRPHAGSLQNNSEDLVDRVKGIVATYLDLPLELLVEEASLLHDLGADSLEITEMMMVFEEEFGCTIDDNAADHLFTVGDIIRHLQNLAEAQD